MKNLIIIGAGGYAKSVLDSLNHFEYKMIGFIDDYKSDKEHLGYPILGNNIEDIKNPEGFFYFIAIGNNAKRTEWFTKIKSMNLTLINIIDQSAIISEHAQIGEGCFVGKMAIINSNVVVGSNCVINTKALLEHGCNIGNHVNVSTNTVLNGDVQVDDLAFVGSCSVINGQLKIGKNVMIGSGAVVISDIPDHSTAVGIPAKVIKKEGVRV